MIPLFVGFDSREAVGYSVFCHSVLTRTKALVSFTPVSGEKRDGSNSFIYSRFLVPYMMDYRGWAIWADGSDMLCLSDIEDLWALRESGLDVLVVKHEYSTKHPIKYLDQRNDDYERKNWSSLMLINCGNYPWRKITPEYVAKASGSHLHRFEFLKDDRIGELPREWNHLVGEYDHDPNIKLAHFTIGIPPFYPNCDYAHEWNLELKTLTGHEHWDSTELVSER